MKAGTLLAAVRDFPAPAEPLPVDPLLVDPWKVVRGLWQRVRHIVLRIGRRPARRLRLCESLPLGERRFVAVLEFEESRFLVGGTSASLVLLARLEDRPPEDRRAEDRATVPAAASGAEAEIASEERP